MKKRKSSFEELKTRAYTREDLDQLSYEEVHALLVQAFQEAVRNRFRFFLHRL